MTERPPYRVEFDRRAAKELGSIEKRDARRLRDEILALGGEPHPPGSIKLAGTDDLYRLRVGNYRVIYAVEEDRLVILIVRVGHRREVYRRLGG